MKDGTYDAWEVRVLKARRADAARELKHHQRVLRNRIVREAPDSEIEESRAEVAHAKDKLAQAERQLLRDSWAPRKA